MTSAFTSSTGECKDYGGDPEIAIPSLSPSSTYSGYDDISDIILCYEDQLPPTQTSHESVPTSTTPSLTSLGKRKASDDLLNTGDVKRSRTIAKRSSGSSDNASTTQSPVKIAYLSQLSECFTKRQLCYGVQYEIARLVSLRLIRYEDIRMDDLDKLKGLNSIAAPKVAKVLIPTEKDITAVTFDREIAAKSPWAELDIEERGYAKDPFAGLGFSTQDPEWYGGKVIFRSRLVEDPGGDYRVVLEQPELGASNRFSRRFGSKSFLRIKIPKVIANRPKINLTDYFSRPFVLWGHVFRSFFAKDNTVFLVCVREQLPSITSMQLGNIGCNMTFVEFLNWHNPITKNSTQSMSKWASRFALGLSTSVPGLQISKNNLIEEAEIISTEGSEMTDGCGFITKLGLQHLQIKFGWHSLPTAVQCRIAGCKGLLLKHPNTFETENRVWVRPSQIKIRYPSEPPHDPATMIVDILRPNHLRTPAQVAPEVIINLAENGVPVACFDQLINENLKSMLAPLRNWDDVLELWVTVERIGGVMAAREARKKAWEARVNGYGYREAEETEVDDEDGLQQLDPTNQRSSAWWDDETSGCPSSLEETVMCLLEAGHEPQGCPVLREKLRQVINTVINSYAQNCRISVPMSAIAFLVPDPIGVLKQGEIHFKSSSRNLLMVDNTCTDIITGDVLVTRYPCKLPSDVQKWTAVEKHELRDLVDVIVFSVQGPRRSADYLAGGDYDGDKGLIIFQPELVRPFRNASLEYSVEPVSVSRCFSQANEKVADFLVKTKAISEEANICHMQKYLLGAIRDTSAVGMYSNFHDYSVYTQGYDHPETIRLAYMFCKILDGAKTGLTILPEVLEGDIAKYQRRGPKWKESDEDKRRQEMKESNETYARRGSKLPKFVMDAIQDKTRKETETHRQSLDAQHKQYGVQVDPDLIAPYLQAEEYVRKCKAEGWSRPEDDLRKIKDHVERMRPVHRDKVNPKIQSTKGKGAAFTDFPIQKRQDIMRMLSKEFASSPDLSELCMLPSEIARVKASYAYYHDSQKESYRGWSRFPWDMAMRELNEIKAKSGGGSKTISAKFHEYFRLKLPRAPKGLT